MPYLTHVPFAFPGHRQPPHVPVDPEARGRAGGHASFADPLGGHASAGPLGVDLPLSRGRLFRSAMPFRYDKGELLAEARREGVRVVVMLVSDKEAEEKTQRAVPGASVRTRRASPASTATAPGHDLRAEYASRDLERIHMPIRDYGVPEGPEKDAFEKSVADCVKALGGDRNVLVHCAAGIGRTGMFLACVLRRIEKIDGGEAVLRVRSVPGMAGAIETQAQEDFVHLFPP